jgi:hypothetical protein
MEKEGGKGGGKLREKKAAREKNEFMFLLPFE